VSSNQNIPPDEFQLNTINENEVNQPLPSLTEQDNLPLNAAINISSSTNDQTEPPMEVHHHGHVHADKKWKEYLFQFLMLFLAITLGFLVENLREHYIENKRAKVLAVSLIEDLKSDITEIDSSISNLNSVIGNSDTVTNELAKPQSRRRDSILQTGAVTMQRFSFFDPQMGTYEQIKNSGSLRYFKQDISKKMTDYEVDKNYIIKMAGNYLEYHQITLVPFLLKLRNMQFLHSVKNKTEYNEAIFKTTPSGETFDLWRANADYLRTQFELQIRIMKHHRELAKDLIESLKKEYHL
jgi:hypothetical protein